jgi:hypothetical protein
VVGGQDVARIDPLASLLEKGVANAPGSGFQALAWIPQESYFAAFYLERDFQIVADSCCIASSSSRILVDSMVQMSRVQAETQRGTDLCQGPE